MTECQKKKGKANHRIPLCDSESGICVLPYLLPFVCYTRNKGGEEAGRNPFPEKSSSVPPLNFFVVVAVSHIISTSMAVTCVRYSFSHPHGNQLIGTLGRGGSLPFINLTLRDDTRQQSVYFPHRGTTTQAPPPNNTLLPIANSIQDWVMT